MGQRGARKQSGARFHPQPPDAERVCRPCRWWPSPVRVAKRGHVVEVAAPGGRPVGLLQSHHVGVDPAHHIGDPGDVRLRGPPPQQSLVGRHVAPVRDVQARSSAGCPDPWPARRWKARDGSGPASGGVRITRPSARYRQDCRGSRNRILPRGQVNLPAWQEESIGNFAAALTRGDGGSALSEWDAYLENRRSAADPAAPGSANARILHLGPAKDWSGFADPKKSRPDPRPRRQPAFRHPGRLQLTRRRPECLLDPFNLAFWRAFEDKVDKANQKGLYIFLAGLMEPYKRYPTSEEAVRFTGWLGGRLAGNFMIYSPGFDSPPPSAGPVTALLKAVGAAIKTTAPHQLVTNHWGGRDTLEQIVAQMETLHNESWLDFEMYQSGFADSTAEEIARRARIAASPMPGPTARPYAISASTSHSGAHAVPSPSRNRSPNRMHALLHCNPTWAPRPRPPFFLFSRARPYLTFTAKTARPFCHASDDKRRFLFPAAYREPRYRARAPKARRGRIKDGEGPGDERRGAARLVLCFGHCGRRRRRWRTILHLACPMSGLRGTMHDIFPHLLSGRYGPIAFMTGALFSEDVSDGGSI